MNYESFCGGIFETNCYLVHAPGGPILFDAPDGACAWVEWLKIEPKLLLLTHGHFDHVPDVAKIKRRFGCPIGCHPDSAPMISDPEFFRSFGFQLELEPVKPDFLIEETPEREFLGLRCRCLKFPDIAPEPLFFRAPGTVAHWWRCPFRRRSWPLGSARRRWRSSFQRNSEKLFPLGDNVTVLPGHGPPTTIGQERLTNPFVT